MASAYLVRFDDICPTMNWDAWTEIEDILNGSGIKPILAVVPDNQDATLRVGAEATDFWHKVRTWQARGWTIGLHGYQHRYVTGQAGVIGLNRRSEFAGLSRPVQEEKLRAGLAIFSREQVIPEVWIAPGHSFDATTLEVLAQLGIGTVSDGFSMYPHRDSRGIFWAPQQLWRFRAMPFGVWTVCLHPNSWGKREIGCFRKDISRFRPMITDFAAVRARFGARPKGLMDSVFEAGLHAAIRVRRFVARSH